MVIVGLTGSIGMGKTTVLQMFSDRGIPTFDADAAVHKLYAGKAANLIEEAFPGTAQNGQVDRKKLSEALGGQQKNFRKLEAIIHPLVQKERHRFLRQAAEENAPIAVLDVPLLFEIEADKDVDVTIVVSAPADVQKERVLARTGMSEEKFSHILSLQIPDEEKRKRADIIVDTGTDMAKTKAQIDTIIETLEHTEGAALQRLQDRL